MPMMLGIILITLMIGLLLGLCAREIDESKLRKLRRYWGIKVGMSETEMLSIMGDGYSRSLLKNDRVKYEWRINASSYGYSYRGVSSRTYSGVKKVSIYTKNGIVEEVKPYNV